MNLPVSLFSLIPFSLSLILQTFQTTFIGRSYGRFFTPPKRKGDQKVTLYKMIIICSYYFDCFTASIAFFTSGSFSFTSFPVMFLTFSFAFLISN